MKERLIWIFSGAIAIGAVIRFTVDMVFHGTPQEAESRSEAIPDIESFEIDWSDVKELENILVSLN